MSNDNAGRGTRATEVAAARTTLGALAVALALTACGGKGAPPAAGGPPPSSPTPDGPAAAVIRSIAVSPGTGSVALGLTQQFGATALYSDGSSAALTTVSWSSSDAQVATIDGSGFADCVATGSVTITATDPTSGVAGTASLTVTPPALQVISIAPPAASVTTGSSTSLSATGYLTDGSSRTLAASELSWTSSDTTIATLGAGGVAYAVSPGSVTVTAVHLASGLSAITKLTITAAPGGAVSVSSTQLPYPAIVGSSGVSRLRVAGLVPGTEYLVRLLPADASLLVQVHAFSTFDAPVCTAYAGTVPCRGGVATAAGELFVLAIGTPSTTFTLDVTPMPVLHAADGSVAGAVDRTETYYKVDGLAAGVHVTLDGLADDADLYVYDGPHGPFGSGQVCSSILGGTSAESCGGSVPNSGVVYVTVEGWLTAAGTAFTLAVAP